MDVEDGQQQDEIWTWDDQPIRGGWLCSEVGMGKTAVVIALAASRPPSATTQKAKMNGRKRVKATIVMTPVSLMAQWEDECQKHAPHLKIARFHPAAPKRQRTYADLLTADIIISSATFEWDKRMPLPFHKMFFTVSYWTNHTFWERLQSNSKKRIPSRQHFGKYLE